MEISVQVLALGEAPTYQMKKHYVQTLNWSRQKGTVSKAYFLDHSKLNVVSQIVESVWGLMTSKIYGNLSDYLTEHHIRKINHVCGNLLNFIRMNLVNIFGHLEVLVSISLSKLNLIIPIFEHNNLLSHLNLLAFLTLSHTHCAARLATTVLKVEMESSSVALFAYILHFPTNICWNVLILSMPLSKIQMWTNQYYECYIGSKSHGVLLKKTCICDVIQCIYDETL